MLAKQTATGRFRSVKQVLLAIGVLTLAACGGEEVTSSSSSASSASSSSSSSSSSSASSSGTTGDIDEGLSIFAAQCAGCHINQGGGDFSNVNLNDLRRTTLDGLADYIDQNMPYPVGSEGACVDQCAEDVAAYMVSTLSSGSSSSSSSGNLAGTPELRGEAQFDNSCAGCHSGPRVQGLWTEEALRDKEIFSIVDLESYIDAEMPQANPSACSGQCAYDVALYISTWHMVPIPSQLTTGEPGVDVPVEEFACNQSTSFGNRTLRLLTQDEYQQTVEDLFGLNEDYRDLLPVDSRSGSFTNNNNLTVRNNSYQQYLIAAQNIAEDVASNNFAGTPIQQLCNSNYDQNCATQFVEEFGRRIFRRPLESSEVEVLQPIASGMDTEGDVQAGIALALEAMLSSPQFLYRHEIGEANNGLGSGAYELTPYELASFLSYAFAGTTPSPDLLDAAENGSLANESGIRQWASRLLDTSSAEAKLEDAVIAWFDIDKLDNFAKDMDLYPGIDQLYGDMEMEMRKLFSGVMLNEERSFSDLYAPGLTYVNQALANHYGIAAPANPDGQGFGAVNTPDRGGLLLNGAFLTYRGDFDEASPIRRAVYVRRHMLCQDVPAPPEGVDVGRDNKIGELGEFLDHPRTTNRMAFHRLTEDGTCKRCHAEIINPLGFGLEDYDTVGRYRTQDAEGNDINALGAVFSPYRALQFYDDPERQIDRVVFNGGQELATMMGEGDLAELTQSCLAMQMISMTTGVDYASITGSERDEVQTLPADEQNSYGCDVQDMVDTLATDSPRAMLEDLGTLESVRYRKAFTR